MNTNKEIKISTLLKIFRKYLLCIAVVALVFAILGGAYAYCFQSTTYTATTQFYIPNFEGSSDFVSDTLLNASESLAEVCSVLVATKNVVEVFAEDIYGTEYFSANKVAIVRHVTSTISSKTLSKGYFAVSVTSSDIDYVFALIQSIQNKFPAEVAGKLSATHVDKQGNITKYETNLVDIKTITSKDEITENNPSVVKNGVMFAFIGAALAYGLVFVKFIFDTIVRDAQDLSENFEDPILAIIPEYYTDDERKQLRKLGRFKMSAQDISKSKRQYNEKLITRKTPFAVAESFNTLRTNLCYSAPGEKCPVFVVTSDFSAAGKSFVSANTSISLASLGKKTLLVECDMRCPDFNRIFNTNVRHGLSEILSGNVQDVDGVIVKTEHENFDIVYSGHVPPNPSALIGSAKMRELLEEWKNTYDYIILDMPPLIEVADASIVASIVSGYIIVARANHSDISAITNIVKDIESVNGNIVGYVVNCVDLKVGGTDMKYDRYSKYAKYNRYGKYAKYSRYSKYAKYAKYSKYRVYAESYEKATEEKNEKKAE